MQLKTPSGAPPSDLRFGDITIEHLLDHKSGLNANAFLNGDLVQQAYAAAGKAINLPVTAEQTDAYVAGLLLGADPGASQWYNNCGFYLLARLVAKLRGTKAPIDAYQQRIFTPLGISRIRRAASLVQAQPTDEARYQSQTLLLQPSDMSNDRPLVPTEYGDEQLEIIDGSGGLTGAVVDQARLIAALVTKSDTAILKRTSVTAMLDASHGFDSSQKLSEGEYRAQKGGSLATSNNVLSFDGQWGLIMAWASPPAAAESSW